MHLATRTSASLSAIEAYHTLAQEASQAIHHEFQAVEQLYLKLLDRYRAQDDALLNDDEKDDDGRGDVRGEWMAWRNDEEVETVTLDSAGMRGIVLESRGDAQAREDAGGDEYIQVIIDCASLKFILDPGKRGYQSGAQLIDDLSELIDRHLEGPHEAMPRIGEVSLDAVLDQVTDPSIKPPKDLFEDAVTTPVDPSSPKPTALFAPTRPPIHKRFTLLIDPPKMLEKNYPTRKEKARTFLAGLFDAENVEMVHIGWGKKGVENQITELVNHHLGITQCAHLFLAVGITSNTSHHVLNLSRPTLHGFATHKQAHKLCIMRSGGPFDSAAWGIGCIAVDRFLSVQVQVPGTGVGAGTSAGTGIGTTTRYVMSGGGREADVQPRERRSFAPSPPSSSARVVSGALGSEKSSAGVVDSVVGGWEGGGTEMAVVMEEKTTNDGMSGSEASSAKVIAHFDPSAIQKTHGKPLCTKYHLNHGACHCTHTQRTQSLHEQVVLEPSASKQLAVWASNQACPEGMGCPDAAERKCCFWFHEPGTGGAAGASGGSMEGKGGDAEEWISVDKKGKPIVTKNLQTPRSWHPSSSCTSHGKLVRSDFQPLTSTIRLFERERNEHKHERGLIGTELKRAYGHDFYRRLGLTGFREYTGLAEKAGLIRLGYFGESAGWISLA